MSLKIPRGPDPLLFIVYWADTGLALHLARLGEPVGAHLENLVLNDLLAWRDVRLDRPEVLYWSAHSRL